MRWLVVLLAGCGRFAFDDIDDACFAPQRMTNLPYAEDMDGALLVCTPAQLDQIGRRREDWANAFVLGRDIDLAELPGEVTMIGDSLLAFTGSLDGGGHTIAHLSLDRPGENEIGLVRLAGGDGRIANLVLADVTVRGSASVGALVAYAVDTFTIQDVTVTGEVVGDSQVGGVMGYSDCLAQDDCTQSILFQRVHAGPIAVSGTNAVGGIIGGLYADSSVDATFIEVSSSGLIRGRSVVGGLIGDGQRIQVRRSSSSMRIEADVLAGGLIGDHLYGESRTIDSVATGDVFCTDNFCGGAFGFQYADAIRVQAHGDVVCGADNCGGLSGYMDDGCDQCVATGDVSGTVDIGGLAGGYTPQANDVLRDSYATGTVTGTDHVGGLVGYANGPIERSYSSSSVNGSNDVGGLVGLLETDTMMGSVDASFALGVVSGASATNAVANLIARAIGAVSTTNVHYAGTCTNSLGTCTQTGTLATASLYAPPTPPLDTWDFATVWEAHPDGPPTLRAVTRPAMRTRP